MSELLDHYVGCDHHFNIDNDLQDLGPVQETFSTHEVHHVTGIDPNTSQFYMLDGSTVHFKYGCLNEGLAEGPRSQ